MKIVLIPFHFNGKEAKNYLFNAIFSSFFFGLFAKRIIFMILIIHVDGLSSVITHV